MWSNFVALPQSMMLCRFATVKGPDSRDSLPVKLDVRLDPTYIDAYISLTVVKWAQDPTEVLDEYGADALRLYLINSPVVRAETLKFRKEGVFSVIKDVMLPWYNAYRFFVQNALRCEAEAGVRFEPLQARSARSRLPCSWTTGV